jgi:hypothetical protein
MRACSSDDFADLEDRLWLKQRRSYLSALATIRHAEKGKNVVSLAVWRDGDLRSFVALAQAAPVVPVDECDYEPASAS